MKLSIQLVTKEISFHYYINNMIIVCLIANDKVNGTLNAVLLILNAIFRPINKNEFVTRIPILSVAKLIAEGCMEEIKTILGWVINTRQL